jgi:hypothetical protein
MRRRPRSCSRRSARSRSLVGVLIWELVWKVVGGVTGVVLRTAEVDWD